VKGKSESIEFERSQFTRVNGTDVCPTT